MAARAASLVGSKPLGAAFNGEDFTVLHLHADRVEQLADIGELEQHADRADQRIALRDDLVGGDGGDIAAGRRDRADDGDHAASSRRGGAARHGASRRRSWCRRGCRSSPARRSHVNSPIDLTRSSVALSPVMMPPIERRAIWGESLAAGPSAPSPNRAKRASAGDGRRRDGENAPKRELAPQAAAIDQIIMRKRHAGPEPPAVVSTLRHPSLFRAACESPWRSVAVRRERCAGA